MKDLEFNKIAAAVLLAGLLAMVAGKIADILYRPDFEVAKRGFEVEVVEGAGSGAAQKEEEKLFIGQLMAAASADAGLKLAKKCTTCHSFEKGGDHKLGPNLWQVMGAPKAGKSGYKYSEALADKGGSWTYDDMFAFLKKPAKYAPGTKMSFAGLKKPKDLANMVAYLRAQSDSQLPLPPVETTPIEPTSAEVTVPAQ